MNRRLALLSLFLVYSCDLLVISSALVVLPPMVLETYTNLSVAQRNLVIGFLLATYPLGQFFLAPIWGELSDRFGRRPILFFTTIGTGLGTCLTALGIMTGNLWLVFASRAVGGIMDGNMTVSMAGVADLSSKQTRGRYMGALTALGGLSWAAGAMLSSVLSDVSLAAPFWVLGLFLLVQPVLIAFAIKPTTGPSQPFRLSHAFTNLGALFRHPRAIWPITVLVGQMVGFYIYITFLSAYLIERFTFSVHKESLAYTAAALAWFVGGVIANQWLLKHFRARRVAILPLILVPLIVLLYQFIAHPWGIWWVVPFTGMGQAIAQASLLTAASVMVGSAMQGKVFGIFQAGVAVASVIGPALSGWLAGFSIQLPFLVAVGVMLVVAVPYIVGTLQRP